MAVQEGMHVEIQEENLSTDYRAPRKQRLPLLQSRARNKPGIGSATYPRTASAAENR